MSGQTSSPQRSAAFEKVLSIFSDKWSFAILQELYFGVCRFDDFQRNLKISRSVLTRRMRHLEMHNIICRKPYSDRPKRYEYHLTERGSDMCAIYFAMQQWGERWLDKARTPEQDFYHRNCGSHLEFTLLCNHCHEPVNLSNIDVGKSDLKY